MRVPKRLSQILKPQEPFGLVYLTKQGIERLHRELQRLEHVDRPIAVEDVSRSRALGDLSENAEYQEAKHRMARIDGRIFFIKERLKQAVEISTERSADGTIQLGSTVTLDRAGTRLTYSIVGPQETDPTRGRISYVSPLGRELQGHRAGDIITVHTDTHTTSYTILDVQ